MFPRWWRSGRSSGDAAGRRFSAISLAPKSPKPARNYGLVTGRTLRREFEMIGGFERFSLLFLAGAVVLAVSGAIVVRMPVAPPVPPTSSTSDVPRSQNITTPASNDVTESSEYDLEAVAAGAAVPRLFDQPPPDQREGGREVPGEENWGRLLPLVLVVNEGILADRKQLWSIRHDLKFQERLSPEQRIWLDLAAERYAAPGDDLDELARRMDVVPPAIVLAAVARMQSAAPVTGRKAKTAVAERAALIRQVLGETPPRLDSPAEAVRAYVRAVNTAAAYEGFRRERQRIRLAGEPLDGLHLAAFLPKFQPSSPFAAEELSAMITAHRLTRLDRARLQPSDPAN